MFLATIATDHCHTCHGCCQAINLQLREHSDALGDPATGTNLSDCPNKETTVSLGTRKEEQR